jgi:hypothetical protein
MSAYAIIIAIMVVLMITIFVSMIVFQTREWIWKSQIIAFLCLTGLFVFIAADRESKCQYLYDNGLATSSTFQEQCRVVSHIESRR